MILSTTGRPKRAYAKKVRPSGAGGTALENYRGLDVGQVDLPALAMELYLLLKEDMRLEGERGVSAHPPR
ncbi:MAG: hypothetical protein KDF65_10225 [Anaerolineae bacterium]|nr:hypothetical protein [Anaerolineae bacterium]